MASFGNGFFSDFVFGKSDWDYKTFEVDADLKATNERTAQALNATEPDLKPFKARGGKLVLYHGWTDPAITPLNTIDYYESVVNNYCVEVRGPGPNAREDHAASVPVSAGSEVQRQRRSE